MLDSFLCFPDFRRFTVCNEKHTIDIRGSAIPRLCQMMIIRDLIMVSWLGDKKHTVAFLPGS